MEAIVGEVVAPEDLEVSCDIFPSLFDLILSKNKEIKKETSWLFTLRLTGLLSF